MRKTAFANEEHYHIFNRGVDKREVFLDTGYYQRFLLSMDLLNDSRDGLMIEWRDFKKSNPKAKLSDFLEPRSRKRDPLVEFVAYCLNPNHYHFILKQVADKGIERLMHKLGLSYTLYFNKRNKRTGALFQGNFKAAHIDSNEYLLYLSAYVNENNFIHGYNKRSAWPYSSLPDYLSKKDDKLVNKDIISGQFKNTREYKEFLDEHALKMKDDKELKRYLIED